ncbi:MAG: cyclic peptide export ABC transporter [Richelia sp. RM2_1_2]|nr:cyclic peptide export ABC transporter [Richelia sp. SM2_1_7]NJM23588.1 cyclic peptide export ABC transporter [Richelia sp. SM1_7_0]NJN08529.1 cyclic peptide export ABC transporter [Richelia sp. RM1_1_1]NJO27254.1 cyclic peptide export ABC transporter [Richelia sp. SL_2_1]NJO57272.1 cyclic peptide export ABC transporter [Richelia sp. RM2_1_2]
MNLIWLLLKASWLQVAIAILTGLISGGTTARLIALINKAISEGFQSSDSLSNLGWQFPILALIVVVNSIISQVLLINLSQEAVYQLRLRLSRGILAAQLQHLEKLGIPRLLATLTEDVATLTATVYAIPFICVDIAIITGCLLYLSSLSGNVFAFTVGFVMIAVGSIQLLINRAQGFLISAREEQDRLFKHFRAITEGIKELKLHSARRQEFFEQELQQSAAISRDQNSAALLTFSVSTGWGNLLFFILVGSLLFVLPQIATVPPATLSAYILTVTYLMLPMQSILDKLQALSKASVALQKIERMGLVLAGNKENYIEENKQDIKTFFTLELKQVVHAYPGEDKESRFNLGPIDLTFKPGEIVFIVGGNGSGKSTLAKLITGLYIPEAGEIILDGKTITDENREWYRQHFSVIFSDFYLFEKLLGIGKPSLDEQAQEYLRQLKLNHKVTIENGKLSTTELSQGQRKRLALLTAYLENRPIYLFDEWASDQDPIFRNIYYKEILTNLKKRHKTVLVISHDDHYFHLADRIIKLDYGKVEYDKVNSKLAVENGVIRHSS